MPAESQKITERLLGEQLATAGTPLSAAQLGQLWRFHGFLRQQNPRLNLTRIYNFHNMVRKHYVDSLLVDRLLREQGLDFPAVTLDLGTGPGFPGIPLAILRPDRRFILAEGRAARVEFLKEAVRVVGLENAEVFGGRVHAGKATRADAVITRAVEVMPATIERMLSYLPPGGLFIFMKGPHCDEEIAEGRRLFERWLELALDAAYTLPASTDHRRLVVWRRTAEPAGTSPALALAETEAIRSRDNDRFKRFKSLHTSRGIKKLKAGLVSGPRLTLEYLERRPELCREILLPEDWPKPEQRAADTAGLLGLREKLGLPLRVFGRELFRELDLIGTGPPLLVIEAPELPFAPPELLTGKGTAAAAGDPSKPDTTATATDFDPGCVLLLPMGDPENLGAALRSAAAFGVQDVVLLAEAAHPYHPRALRAAAGATPGLRLYRGPALAELGRVADALMVLDGQGEDLRNLEVPAHFVLLAGPEGGLAELEAAAEPGKLRKIRIPTTDSVESLNTSVALSIALFVLADRRRNP